MTVHEFQEFAAALPRLPGRIVAIKFLAGRSGNVPDTVGVLTYNEKNGWQVAVFDRRRDHRFVLDWSSGKLDSSFAGSDPDAMENVPGAGEDLIVFHGCAPHTCPDVFAYLLYVPSKRKAFEAHYLRGKTTYSPELNKPENKEYLEVLQQEIKYNREGAPQ